MHLLARGAPDILCEHDMLAKEKQAVATGRKRSEDGPWLGLALSGGGIRSATFCLGALQRLAAVGLLRHFDYMSSVSGGGYTAASVQWWWQRKPETDASDKFPYGTALVAPAQGENENLRFLRWHASYLAPGGGILDLVSDCGCPSHADPQSAGVATRRHRHDDCSRDRREGDVAQAFILVADCAHSVDCAEQDLRTRGRSAVARCRIGKLVLTCGDFLAVASILIPPETKDNRGERIARAVRCFALGVVFGWIGLFLLIEFRSFTDLSNFITDLDFQSQIAWMISGFLTVFGFIALAAAVLQLTGRLEFGVNYALRRRFKAGATTFFAAFFPLVVLGSLPLAETFLSGEIIKKGGPFLGLFAVGSGLFSGLYGHFVQAQRVAPKYASLWMATLAAAIFIYACLLASHAAASFLLDPATHKDYFGRWCQVIFPALLCFSLLFGWFSNLNSLGLHRFYRDRLMEAFLPTDLKLHAGAPSYTDADRTPLADFWPPQGEVAVERPYPLINTNAIMINDSDLNTALRGGDSFVLSPLFVGSKSAGWCGTVELGLQHSPLTLASAMAASGAAANANAAYIGAGITRDRLISIVMMLLNMRLGLWLGTPGTRSGNTELFLAGI